jgi:C1A family cysteine protease
MKSFIAAALAATVSADVISQKFMEYVITHSKSYTTVEEFLMRKHLFARADAEIEASNAEGNNFTLGHNKFSDFTKSEYTNMLGFVSPISGLKAAKHHTAHKNGSYTPVDWRTEGAVTPVKDQGQCGSCWTFSSTGALEGAHQIASGELLSFSEQQLVDCARFVAFGCNGGNESTAFNYLEKHAIMLEEAYPYTAVDTADCLQSDDNTGIFVSDWTAVTPQSVDALKESLSHGPTSVNIDAESVVFQLYSGGVLDSSRCGTSIDHAVLAVGWGVDDTAGEYWIVKNSWAEVWGDEGYVKIAAVEGMGICGVQSGPFRPEVTA